MHRPRWRKLSSAERIREIFRTFFAIESNTDTVALERFGSTLDTQRIGNAASALDANVRAQVRPPTRVDYAQCFPGPGPAFLDQDPLIQPARPEDVRLSLQGPALVWSVEIPSA
jgi:hypothetical protein